MDGETGEVYDEGSLIAVVWVCGVVCVAVMMFVGFLGRELASNVRGGTGWWVW